METGARGGIRKNHANGTTQLERVADDLGNTNATINDPLSRGVSHRFCSTPEVCPTCESPLSLFHKAVEVKCQQCGAPVCPDCIRDRCAICGEFGCPACIGDAEPRICGACRQFSPAEVVALIGLDELVAR